MKIHTSSKGARTYVLLLVAGIVILSAKECEMDRVAISPLPISAPTAQ